MVLVDVTPGGQVLYICVVYIHIPLLKLNLEETGNL